MSDQKTSSTSQNKNSQSKQQQKEDQEQELNTNNLFSSSDPDPIYLNSPLHAVFIGPSGCGKTVQAQRIVEAISKASNAVHFSSSSDQLPPRDTQPQYPMTHINLRESLTYLKDHDHSEVGQYLRQFWRTSHITSNVADVSLKIVADKLNQMLGYYPESEPSFIIEGTPQTLTEASKLEQILDSKKIEINCAIKFEISEELIHERFHTDPKYIDSDSKAAQHRRRNLASVAKYYLDRNVLHVIDASKSPDQVYEQVEQIITEERHKHQVKRWESLIEPVKYLGTYLESFSRETIDVKRKMKAYSGSQFDKFPGSHSVSLHRRILEDMKHRSGEYVYSIKANGMRFFLLLSAGHAYFINRKLEVYRCSHLFPQQILNSSQSECLFDGEIVTKYNTDARQDNQFRIVYIIFDVLYVGSTNVKRLPLFSRLKQADIFLVNPFHMLRQPQLQYAFPFTSHYLQDFLFYQTQTEHAISFNVCIQHYYKFYEIQDVLCNYIHHRSYPTDGLVFSHLSRPYKLGLDEQTRKWKPLHQNTIDFALSLKEDHEAVSGIVKGRSSFKSNIQNNGNNDNDNDNMEEKEHQQDTDTLQVLNDNGCLIDYCSISLTEKERQGLATGMIVECWWCPNSEEDIRNIGDQVGTGPGAWRLLRVRSDKDTPNPEWLVHRIWDSIKDALTQDELIDTLKNAVQDRPPLYTYTGSRVNTPFPSQPPSVPSPSSSSSSSSSSSHSPVAMPFLASRPFHPPPHRPSGDYKVTYGDRHWNQGDHLSQRKKTKGNKGSRANNNNNNNNNNNGKLRRNGNRFNSNVNNNYIKNNRRNNFSENNNNNNNYNQDNGYEIDFDPKNEPLENLVPVVHSKKNRKGKKKSTSKTKDENNNTQNQSENKKPKKKKKNKKHSDMNNGEPSSDSRSHSSHINQTENHPNETSSNSNAKHSNPSSNINGSQQ